MGETPDPVDGGADVRVAGQVPPADQGPGEERDVVGWLPSFSTRRAVGIKDREKSVMSSEAFVKLAMIQLMLNRLQPKGTDAEFHYRQAA